MKKYYSIYLALAIVVGMCLQSCDKKEENTISDVNYDVYSVSSTLVSSFSLKANTKILNNLDSVKFTIDQERGLIYNADSLPRGTRVNALLVNLSCASTVASKEFVIKNGTRLNDTTIVYSSSKNDSIDFTGDVTLRITSGNKLNVRDYKVKLNVHKQDVDTIEWSASHRRDLPNVSSSLFASKTVMLNDKFLCLVDVNDSYVLSLSEDPLNGPWEETLLSLPFTPQVASFTATDNDLYMLDANGQLFKSADFGNSWSDCGVAWRTIIGGYGDKLLGVAADGGTFVHVEYANSQNQVVGPVEDIFPIEGMSPIVMASNEWTSNQQAMTVGGVTADGQFSNRVWGYDGELWAPINSDDVLPALRDAVLFPYYTMVKSGGASQSKKVTWMVMGGKMSDGELNVTSFVSRNQGINWSIGESSVQQPDYMPAFYGAQVYTYDRTRSAGSTLRAYNPGQVTPVTQWQCPYIYLFGGYGRNGVALNNVWEGVLLGLTFKPVF